MRHSSSCEDRYCEKTISKNMNLATLLSRFIHWKSIIFCIGTAELGIGFNSNWVSFMGKYKRCTFNLVENKTSNRDFSHTFFTKFSKIYIFGIDLNRPWHPTDLIFSYSRHSSSCGGRYYEKIMLKKHKFSHAIFTFYPLKIHHILHWDCRTGCCLWF